MTTDLSKVPINRWVKILHPLKWNTNRFSIEIHFEFWFFFILLAGNAPNHHRIPDLAFSAELIDPPSIGMTILRFAAYTPIGWKGNVFAGKKTFNFEIGNFRSSDSCWRNWDWSNQGTNFSDDAIICDLLLHHPKRSSNSLCEIPRTLDRFPCNSQSMKLLRKRLTKSLEKISIYIGSKNLLTSMTGCVRAHYRLFIAFRGNRYISISGLTNHSKKMFVP